MKIILSRKGFDSSLGGYPSPILPDGRMVSLPIPHGDCIRYSDLHLEDDKTYYDLMKELKPTIKHKGKWEQLTQQTRCHLDPDVYRNAYCRKKGWKPLFGQVGTAQSHLRAEGVERGDMFLFFGWFKAVKKNGQYSYDSRSPHLHLIFAYFQIGEMLDRKEIIKIDESNTGPRSWMKYHPHVAGVEKRPDNNTVYTANNFLSWDSNLPGAGTFHFSQDLVLTKEGFPRSKWKLPECFRNVRISYHSEKNWHPEYLQSAARGQEFVVEENEEIEAWAKELIGSNFKCR